MNNLCGWAMSEYLPYGEFEWLKNVDRFDVMAVSEKSPIGYFLEVDLEYSDELHEIRNGYPLASRVVSNDILSKYCKEIDVKHEIKSGNVKKLIPNLDNITKYVLHYRNLQVYLSLGMRLPKYHKVSKFKQSDWMKKYINFNTEKRKKCYKNDLFKLMINSVYGKTMENL